LNNGNDVEKSEYTKEEVDQIKNDLNDKYLRLFAEFDNYKRRVAKEKDDNNGGTIYNNLRQVYSVVDTITDDMN
jgi:molecular chaperone GrpE (heat shock protein)